MFSRSREKLHSEQMGYELFLTRAKSWLKRFLMEVLIDFINPEIHCFSKTKLFQD